MLGLKLANLSQASLVVLLSIWSSLPSSLARADDLTGASQDDPKDLLPTPPPLQRSDSIVFLPMPSWARGVTMPPLPYQLKPMGKKPVAIATTPTPAPLAPPPDGSTPATTASAPKPKNPAESDPDFIAVSPFLQWIKANPQAAAAEARRQAGTYVPPPPVGANAIPGGAPGAAPGNPNDNYWLPPLIDSPDFGSQTVGGSAAIYSRPQR